MILIIDVVTWRHQQTILVPKKWQRKVSGTLILKTLEVVSAWMASTFWRLMKIRKSSSSYHYETTFVSIALKEWKRSKSYHQYHKVTMSGYSWEWLQKFKGKYFGQNSYFFFPHPVWKYAYFSPVFGNQNWPRLQNPISLYTRHQKFWTIVLTLAEISWMAGNREK